MSSVTQPLPADGGIDVLEMLMKLHDLMDEATAHAVLQYFVSTGWLLGQVKLILMLLVLVV